MTSEEPDSTGRVRRSDLPWYLSTGFTAGSMVVSLVIWALTVIVTKRPLWGLSSSAAVAFEMALHLSVLGGVLGILSGVSRAQAMQQAACLSVDDEPTEDIGSRREDRYVWATFGTCAGRRSVIAELVAIGAGAAIGIASHSLTPAIIVFTSFTTCEQAVYLWWLRGRPA